MLLSGLPRNEASAGAPVLENHFTNSKVKLLGHVNGSLFRRLVNAQALSEETSKRRECTEIGDFDGAVGPGDRRQQRPLFHELRAKVHFRIGRLGGHDGPMEVMRIDRCDAGYEIKLSGVVKLHRANDVLGSS